MMKKLAGLTILSILLTACNSSIKEQNANLKGSGAGGIIKVNNNTDDRLYLTWSGVGGVGCGGIEQGLSLVCESGSIPAGQNKTYKYNWGVTTTWLNVATYKDPDGVSACSPEASTAAAKDCIFDHHVVDTKAHDTSVCDINEDEREEKYTISCKR